MTAVNRSLRDVRARLALALLCAPVPVLGAQRPLPTIPLRAGLVITHSARIAPGTYRLTAPASLDSALITVRGDDIDLDLSGVRLVGLDPELDPDLATGVAIRVDGGRNVRIRNVSVRGYHVGLRARGTRALTISGADFSYNWKPRLFSGMAHESLVDWLSHHHNEADEWLRFGAGIYLADVTGGEVRETRITQGMEGLMLVRTDSMRIWNNTIAFNSGVGIALYRSSGNIIMHNRASYNVRGYSHGYYRRGQDSADLLIYEQSSHNVVAYNSMTHGGDGFFLWAGQHTMDTGEGGANDNLVYGNDFSYAPTNGIEATFSRNTFVANRVAGSDYGVWGGYSFESAIIGNAFVGNRVGVAIEHGQHDTIAGNSFDRDSLAIDLWANAIEPGDWGYPKHRDTRSRDMAIVDNTIRGARIGVRLANTVAATVARNAYVDVDSPLVRRDSAPLASSRTVALSRDASSYAPPRIPGARDALATDALARRDRSAIIVDEWGPYDWQSPRLWPVDTSTTDVIRLRVLGPTPGTWRVVDQRGIAMLSRSRGRVGDTIAITPANTGDWAITAEYLGGVTVSPRGLRRAAGTPYRLTWTHFAPEARWDVRVVAWKDSTDPRTAYARFAESLGGAPLVSLRPQRLDYMWYRPSMPEIPPEQWAAIATTAVDLPAGEYTLRTISDDGIRVWVDGTLAIDHWAPHESAVDYAALAPGRHTIRVEYFQVSGWAELRVDILRGHSRSPGSPGPH